MAEYIERDKFRNILEAKAEMALGTPKQVFYNTIAMLDLIPAADVVEIRHGEWKEIDNVAIEHGMLIAKGRTWRCGVCGEARKTLTKPNMNYCPNCGAKMDGERGKEE